MEKEVDHVGGTAKVTVRRLAAGGEPFLNASDVVNALIQVHEDSTHLSTASWK